VVECQQKGAPVIDTDKAIPEFTDLIQSLFDLSCQPMHRIKSMDPVFDLAKRVLFASHCCSDCALDQVDSLVFVVEYV
jgi:hypothetical protein